MRLHRIGDAGGRQRAELSEFVMKISFSRLREKVPKADEGEPQEPSFHALRVRVTFLSGKVTKTICAGHSPMR